MSDGIVRPVPETTPIESEASAPNGEPIAATGCPTATVGGVPERHRRETVRRGRHPQHTDVVVRIPAHDLGRDTVAVVELDIDAARGRGERRAGGRGDHVGGGEDVTGAIDHEAGALLERRAGGLAAEVGEHRDDARVPLRVDLLRREAAREHRLGDDHRRRQRRADERLAHEDGLRPAARPSAALDGENGAPGAGQRSEDAQSHD